MTRMGYKKGDWKLGVAWVIIMVLLVCYLWSSETKGASDVIVVRPEVVSWNHEPYEVTLSIVTDEEGVAVSWGDGCKTLREDVDGDVTLVHKYTMCADEIIITIALGHFENGKLKFHRIEKSFHVIGCH